MNNTQAFPKRALHRFPGRGLALVQHGARARRIPQVQHCRLLEGSRRAEARGMRRVPLDLVRPPVLRAHEHAGSGAFERQGGRDWGNADRARVNDRRGSRHSGSPFDYIRAADAQRRNSDGDRSRGRNGRR